MRKDDGFTGLEAAIVLIAFVVVAAVFSYVVLGAGFFTTQKSQQVVHSSVSQASSTMELSGPVNVQAKSADTVANVSFYLQLAAGGTSVDLTKVTYTASTIYNQSTFTDTSGEVNRTWVSTNTTPNLLDLNQMVLVTIDISSINVRPSDKFVIEVKPATGAALPISKTAPAALTTDKWYEVY
ncbi:MAG: archaellin/type IV pilin N-terminal domain-containing protein [Methanoregulaceae archaeon]